MNKKVAIIVVFLLILVVAGAGVWQWQNQRKVEAERQVILEKQAEEVKRLEEKKQVEQDEIDTSDWKTYRDERLGFEFKYPEEANINPGGESVILHRDCSRLKNKDFLIQMNCDLESNISFGVTTKTIEQVIESYKDDCQQSGRCFVFIASQEDYFLDGIKGKKLIGNNAEGVGALNYIYATSKDKNYIISFVHLDSAYLSVLSTFKFIK